MRRFPSTVVGAVFGALALAGCIGGPKGPTRSPGRAGAVGTVGMVATAMANGAAPPNAPGSSASTNPAIRSPFSRGLETPGAAAKNLWDAWRDDDRERALVAADPEAVATLFKDPWGPEVDDQGCAVVIADSHYRCAFVQGTAARIIDVYAIEGRYRVTRTERIGEFAMSSGPLAQNRPGPAGGPTIVSNVRPAAARSAPQRSAARTATSTVPDTVAGVLADSVARPTTLPVRSKKGTKPQPGAATTPVSVAATTTSRAPASPAPSPAPIPVRVPASTPDTAAP